MNRVLILKRECTYFKSDMEIIKTKNPALFLLGLSYWGTILFIVYAISGGYRVIIGR